MGQWAILHSSLKFIVLVVGWWNVNGLKIEIKCINPLFWLEKNKLELEVLGVSPSGENRRKKWVIKIRLCLRVHSLHLNNQKINKRLELEIESEWKINKLGYQFIPTSQYDNVFTITYPLNILFMYFYQRTNYTLASLTFFIANWQELSLYLSLSRQTQRSLALKKLKGVSLSNAYRCQEGKLKTFE